MTDHVAFLFPVIDLIDEQEGMARPHGALMDTLKASQNFPPALQALARLKDLDIALSMAQKAKSFEPETPSITDTLAWVMYKRGNYASAMPLLREAVQKSPDSAEYHYHLGMNLIASGQKATGKKDLEEALRLKPDSASEQQVRQALAQLN